MAGQPTSQENVESLLRLVLGAVALGAFLGLILSVGFPRKPATITGHSLVGFSASPATQPEHEAQAATDTPASKQSPDQPQCTFDGRPIRPLRVLPMEVTAYSPDARSCGKWADGMTASGFSVWTNGMKLVAADTQLLPFGSLVSVPGYYADRVVPVLDRGTNIKGNKLDVLFATHEQAVQWGRQLLDVRIWEYADTDLVTVADATAPP